MEVVLSPFCFMLFFLGIACLGSLLALWLYSVMTAPREPSTQERRLAQIHQIGEDARKMMDHLSSAYRQRIKAHANRPPSHNGVGSAPSADEPVVKTRRRKGEVG